MWITLKLKQTKTHTLSDTHKSMPNIEYLLIFALKKHNFTKKDYSPEKKKFHFHKRFCHFCSTLVHTTLFDCITRLLCIVGFSSAIFSFNNLSASFIFCIKTQKTVIILFTENDVWNGRRNVFKQINDNISKICCKVFYI